MIKTELEVLWVAILESEAEHPSVATTPRAQPAVQQNTTASSPFGRYKRKAPATPVPNAPHANQSIATSARNLAQRELMMWRTSGDDFFEDSPLLPEVDGQRFNPIEWWEKKARGNILRGLAHVALTYLVVWATAGRPERTFSWSGIINSARRGKLGPRKLGRQVYVKRNNGFVPSSKEMKEEYLRRRKAKSFKSTIDNTTNNTLFGKVVLLPPVHTV